MNNEVEKNFSLTSESEWGWSTVLSNLHHLILVHAPGSPGHPLHLVLAFVPQQQESWRQSSEETKASCYESLLHHDSNNNIWKQYQGSGIIWTMSRKTDCWTKEKSDKVSDNERWSQTQTVGVDQFHLDILFTPGTRENLSPEDAREGLNSPWIHSATFWKVFNGSDGDKRRGHNILCCMEQSRFIPRIRCMGSLCSDSNINWSCTKLIHGASPHDC